MVLPITLIGRINCIKMNVLPRLQYLFQSLPITFPPVFFKSLNKSVRQFIWNGKVARRSLEILSWEYKSGGLQLPNFKKYYYAAQMRFILSMFDGESTPSWINIAFHSLRDDTFCDFVYKYNPKMLSKLTDNPILIHLNKLWYDIHKQKRLVCLQNHL